MRLSKVYARFYKSFNFDRIRKAKPGAEPRGGWEMFRGQWYPYVEIRIDQRLTTVVGANESGKSHLLSAIEKAVTGLGFARRDLCRYCPFFGVTADEDCWPHLGVSWTEVGAAEWDLLASLLSTAAGAVSEFMMFREGPAELTVWVPVEGEWRPHRLDAEGARAFTALLPAPYRIHSSVALPDSVPLGWLVRGSATEEIPHDRRTRATLLDGLLPLAGLVGPDPSSIVANAASIFSVLRPVVGELGRQPERVRDARSLALARSLLLDLARIDPQAIAELAEAIADGQDGYANALVESVNAQLERSLNLRRWWAQDRDFVLRVAPREHDLVFTIRDRTGTEYTFAERSSGLKYFLSYLIQSQAHRPASSRERILLMDEPDTYLSAEAQQDLMRILRDLAEPRSERPAIQVVYVTHSPFLIDKNHAERIRVLEKGRGLDGTLVVDNAAQNHYEPLRSAFGSYVGETAFVGSANLLVEGITEQVLLAGASRAIRRSGVGGENDSLDLNGIVIVPCGSASHVPYMVHLVRGRDAEKPPLVVLLDSDAAGDEAAKLLGRKPLSRLLASELVLQLGSVEQDVEQVREIEDLMPAPLAAAAANACLREVSLYRSGRQVSVAAEELAAGGEPGLFDRLTAVLAKRDARIEKLPFARAVVGICEERPRGLEDAVDLYLGRMRALFRVVNRLRRRAEGEAGRDRLSQVVDREQQLFVRDHPLAASRESVANLLEDVEALLDASPEADAIRVAVQRIRREHRLDQEPARPVDDMAGLARSLAALKDALAIERLQLDPAGPGGGASAPAPASSSPDRADLPGAVPEVAGGSSPARV